jgi:membrane-associated protein
MDWIDLLQMIVHLDQQLDGAIAQLGSAAYLLLFAVVFCEIAFIPVFFLPGDPLLFISGALCATGALSIWFLMPLLFVACVAGSIVSYQIGRAAGDRVSSADYKWLNRAALARTRVFYERHGAATFLLSPFVAVVRTFAPFVAGMARMSFGKFLVAAICGAGLWVFALIPGGYLFGSIPLIREHLSAIVLLGIGAGVGALFVGSVWRFISSRRGRP